MKSFLFVLFLTFSNFSLLANIVVLNGLSHHHKMIPGETYTGQIIIQNTKESEQMVSLYLRDYLFYKSGEIKYDEPGNMARSNTHWIKLSPANAILSPLEKKVISYEIKVPEQLSLDGTFWSVVMLESKRPVGDNAYQTGLQINTQVRYAVQLITNVGTKHSGKGLEISDVRLTKIKRAPAISVDVANAGAWLLTPHITIELFDNQGNSVGVFRTSKRKTFPQTSLRFLLNLEGTSPGSYKALLLADCGEENVYGMNLNITLE